MPETLLITGGASGIGAATARLAAARGYKVAVNYRSRRQAAEAIVADIAHSGGEAIALPGDVAHEADIVRLFDETEKRLGPLTRLVNSAGVGGGMFRVADLDAAALAEMMAINVTGLMLCCREAARRMSTRRGGKGGSIVNVSSMAGTFGGRSGKSHYAASKAAVDAFTKGFAREVAREGIRINVVRPGMVLTEMTEDNLRDPTAHADVEASIPMGRVGTATELAAAVLWLLSDDCPFMSGARLDVSGGGFVIGKPRV